MEGRSLRARVRWRSQRRKKPIFWEHEGNAAVRMGKWKLVRDYPAAWELYDMEADRTELQRPRRAASRSRRRNGGAYEAWAKRCGVIPREKIVA